LRDAWSGKLEQIYDYLGKLPNLQGEPLPILAREDVRCCDSKLTTMDLGRGCPYQCSFCTIINVHGQKSRFRSPDDLEEIIRQNHSQNLRRFFITDDNFARNRNWEALFDRLIELRAGEFWKISFIIQVDALCHKIPNFVEKAARAGVIQVFIGLENINPDNLIAAKKRQNKITEYREMLQKWREHGIITLAGYIIGFPGDTKSSVLRDIEIIKRELPIDILDMVCLTPLPGSEDHKILWEKGIWMDPDLNKYDTHHRVTHHARMSDAEWEDAYRTAWEAFYTPEHIRTVLRRTARCKLGRPRAVLNMLLWFKFASSIEGVHPLEFGACRLKFRRDRRSDLPRESPFLFYPRYVGEHVAKLFRYLRTNLQAQSILKEVLAAPDRWTYSDTAIAVPDRSEFETLDLYQATSGGKAALARKHRDDAVRTAAHAAV
jgi:hypothetical protein